MADLKNQPPLVVESVEEHNPGTHPDALPHTLPVLPLRDVVLFPGMVVPLVVDSARSMRLIDDAAAGHRWILVSLQRNQQVDDDKAAGEDLHPYGCMTRVIRVLKFPDETVRVLVQGVARARMLAFVPGKDYLQAAYVRVDDQPVAHSLELEALTRNLAIQFQEIIAMSPTLPDELGLAALNAQGPGQLSDLIAAHLTMSLGDRQQLLSSANPQLRLTKLASLVNREHEVLRLGSEIQTKVSETFSKTQREHVLREQLKAIKNELGEMDQQQGDLKEIDEKIARAKLPEAAQQVATKERNRLLSIPSASPEYGVIRTYLDWLTELPWDHLTEDHLDIEAAKAVLDHDHYDLKEIKDRILEFLAVLKLKRDLKGPILCFAGPPGVGKTSLGQSIARALGRKFIRMSLGGVRDEAEIRGHRRTYIGSMPGRIIQGLRNAGTRNPVFMLDEIDKLGSDFRGDPSSALLEVLDPEQNHSFSDHYLDVPFNLSSVLFITTANVLHTIPDPLRDRMEVLNLAGYTQQEKLQIATKYLVPKQIREHGLKNAQIRFRPRALEAIIANYTREAGVRQLERQIATACRKRAREVASGNTAGKTLGPDSLKELLGPIRFDNDVAERSMEPGISTGLAWTSTGGDILFVEASRMEGQGRLILTGSLGEVMKESARAALTYVRANVKRLAIEPLDFEKLDLHVHVPAGSIPKDGPSAGVAIALALVSLLRAKPLDGRTAMTGEISLRGKVLPVGGIKEKVLAAARAGIRSIILPERNRVDLDDVPPEVQRKLRFHFVKTIEEAVSLLLAPRSRPRAARKPAS